MYVRLAFSVAAHLNPEILIVDEVLAVGDAEFQKKCLNKMSAVSQNGRTVLFVSHNMAAVNRLCSRAILLDHGHVVREGSAGEVTSAYLASGENSGQNEVNVGQGVNIHEVILFVGKNRGAQVARVADPLRIQMHYTVTTPQSFHCVVALYFQGLLAFASVEPSARFYAQPGDFAAEVTIPPHLLAEGTYSVDVYLLAGGRVPQEQARRNDAVRFHVFDPLEGDSARGEYSGPFGGVIRPKLQWQTSIQLG